MIPVVIPYIGSTWRQRFWGFSSRLGGIFFIWRQSRIAAEAAKSARDSAQAAINAGRAWIMTELQWTADIPDAKSKTTLRETADTIQKTTSVSVSLIAKNEGKCPAWITEIIFWLRFCDSLPGQPDTHAPDSFTCIGPESVSVEKSLVLEMRLQSEGLRTYPGGLPLFIYGVVFYRDAFGENHQTWCAYSIVDPPDKPKLQRLAGYPDYNKNT